ncbi:MAG: hypothetical protein AAFY15_06330 [Cyanobacteria bacterium J06648_11]
MVSPSALQLGLAAGGGGVGAIAAARTAFSETPDPPMPDPEPVTATPVVSGDVEPIVREVKVEASETDDEHLTGEEIFAVIVALVVFAIVVSLFFFSGTFGFGAGRRLDDLPRPDALLE